MRKDAQHGEFILKMCNARGWGNEGGKVIMVVV